MPTVTYNSYTLPQCYEKLSHSEDFRGASVSVDFLITAASSSALVAACATAETDLTEINKTLTVSLGGSSEYSYSHTSNTGFLARPTLRKLTNQATTGISRMYNFSCQVQLPMTQYDARRKGEYHIVYLPTRQRQVSFTCEYTAAGSDSALESYNDGSGGGKAWAATILSALGGVYELISENLAEEQENKVINASLNYKEILFDQSLAVTDNASIVDCTAHYAVNFAQEIGQGQSVIYTVSPRVQVSISYAAKINREQVLAAGSIDALYHATIRPYLINQAYAILGLANYSQAGQGYIISSENKNYDPYAYTISGNLAFLAQQSGAVILDFSERIILSEKSGINDVKMWNGIPFSYSSWSIGEEADLTRIITIGQLYSEPKTPPPYGEKNGEMWGLRGRNSSFVRSKMGIGSGPISGTSAKTADYWVVSWTEQYKKIVPVELFVVSGG